MSKYKIMYSPAAYADLDNIVSYIIDHFKDRKAAKNLSDAIRSKVRSLDDMPERFAQVEWEPWASMNMHRFPIKNYIVFSRPPISVDGQELSREPHFFFLL